MILQMKDSCLSIWRLELIISKIKQNYPWGLRTFALIVSAHPTTQANSHTTSCMSARQVIKWTNDRADSYWLFLDLTILDVRWPLFFFWWIFFSTNFLALAKKWRKSMEEVWIFCKMHDRIPLFLALRSSVRRFQMPFEGLRFVKTLVKLDLFTQQAHFYKIRPRSFASADSPSIFSTINHCRPCWITCANLSKSG